jgi:hypothetical protein
MASVDGLVPSKSALDVVGDKKRGGEGGFAKFAKNRKKPSENAFYPFKMY